jgi:hypothetical protein
MIEFATWTDVVLLALGIRQHGLAFHPEPLD